MKIFAGLLALFAVATAGSAGAGVAAVGNTDPASAVWVSDPGGDGTQVDAGLPVGYRNPRSAEEAVRWALGQVGVNRDTGHCLRFVNLAYGRPSGPPSAYLVWTRSNPNLHRFTGPPPRGSVVVWSNAIGGGHGHIGVSLGDGTMVSTTSGAVSILSIKGYADSAYFGWMPPYFYM
ncbi:MAG: hypothetical protein H6524_00415 [Actinobacteria bacterium]|nr:hypothetical protein [Actinomycetota bacterium]MCB9427254.1 hypothetical protein [Actinomycetota bacterium]HPJ17655.1 hypothetical protein [Actinomycetota bacterium]